MKGSHITGISIASTTFVIAAFIVAIVFSKKYERDVQIQQLRLEQAIVESENYVEIAAKEQDEKSARTEERHEVLQRQPFLQHKIKVSESRTGEK